jgi:hypothetical protein
MSTGLDLSSTAIQSDTANIDALENVRLQCNSDSAVDVNSGGVTQKAVFVLQEGVGRFDVQVAISTFVHDGDDSFELIPVPELYYQETAELIPGPGLSYHETVATSL